MNVGISEILKIASESTLTFLPETLVVVELVKVFPFLWRSAARFPYLHQKIAVRDTR